MLKNGNGMFESTENGARLTGTRALQRAKRMLCTLFVLTFCLLAGASAALAAPAYPGPINFVEPATEQKVQVYNNGDESFNFITDRAGNVLLVDSDGFLRRVAEQNDAYVLSAYVTGQLADPEAAGEAVTAENVVSEKLSALREAIAAATPQLFGLSDRIGKIPAAYDYIGDAAQGRVHVCTEAEDTWLDDVSNYPARESTCALLVLKVQYADVKCVFSDAEWHKRIFEDGVSPYYTAVSNGAFTYVPAAETSNEANDGVVTVTLPFNAPPYTLASESNQNVQNDPEAGIYRGSDDKNYAIYNMGSIFAYALLQAEDSIDFAAYDRNDDGYISPTELAVLVVYSGYEAGRSSAEAVEGLPAVWAHSWKFNNMLSDVPKSSYHYCTISVGNAVDKKQLFKYTVVGELACTPGDYDLFSKDGTPVQAQFGTATHELGHDLGLPDLYATNGARTDQSVYYLSLMANGSWGSKDEDEPGSSPCYLDPYSKIDLGFYSATTIDNGSYTLYAADPPGQYNILRINTADPDVYYLLENREPVGFDVGLEWMYGGNGDYGGIVIWRIDEHVIRETRAKNTINNTNDHYGIMPLVTGRYNNWPFWATYLSDENLAKLQSYLPMVVPSDCSLNMNFQISTELTFAHFPAYDVPAGVLGTAIEEIDLSGGVTGGEAPYAFTLSEAPEWLSISPAGVLSGTRPALAAEETAMVTVVDRLLNAKHIIINVGVIAQPLKITAQPVDASVTVGQQACFEIEAEGTEVSYQWYGNFGDGWQPLMGEKAARFITLPAVLADNGTQFACIVTDVCDNSLGSEMVTLKVTPAALPPTGDAQRPAVYALLVLAGLLGWLLLRRRAY